MRFAYDSEANALAITFADDPVAKTVEVDPGTLVDLGAGGELLTIEVISPARQWPLEEIAATYAITEENLRVLREMFAGGRQGTYAFTQQAHVAGGDRDMELVGA
jgi:uncharacterized protein YuzE